MGSRVFFSFDQRDLWRAQVVRNSGAAESVALGSFMSNYDGEQLLRTGEEAIKAAIERALERTSVTIVLIGAETVNSRWVPYEIECSVGRGNALIGIRVHLIKDVFGAVSEPGRIPEQLLKIGAPVYDWKYGHLRQWIEAAEGQRMRVANGREV